MEPSHLAPCLVGDCTNAQDHCHKTTYCRTVNLSQIHTLSVESKHLLETRSGAVFDNEDTICNYHEKFYLSRYESLQKSCCDPHSVHVHKKIRRKYRPMRPRYNIVL